MKKRKKNIEEADSLKNILKNNKLLSKKEVLELKNKIKNKQIVIKQMSENNVKEEDSIVYNIIEQEKIVFDTVFHTETIRDTVFCY